MTETKTFDVHVRNIGANPNKDEIQKQFSAHGEVAQVRFVTDKETEQTKDYCFVAFTEESGADSAVKGLDGTTVGGQEIKVQKARGKGSSTEKCFNCQRPGHMAKDCRNPGGAAYVPPNQRGGYDQGGYGGYGYGGGYGGGPAYGPGYGEPCGYGPPPPGYGPGGYGPPPSGYGPGGYEQSRGGYGGGRGGNQGGGFKLEARPGDWRCEQSNDGTHCGNLNFARRDACNKCGVKKPPVN